MSDAELLIEEIRTLPKGRVAEVLDFVEFLKQKETRNTEEPRFNAETIAAFKEGDAMLSGEIPATWHKSLEDLNKMLDL